MNPMLNFPNVLEIFTLWYFFSMFHFLTWLIASHILFWLTEWILSRYRTDHCVASSLGKLAARLISVRLRDAVNHWQLLHAGVVPLLLSFTCVLTAEEKAAAASLDSGERESEINVLWKRWGQWQGWKSNTWGGWLTSSVCLLPCACDVPLQRSLLWAKKNVNSCYSSKKNK